MIAPRLGEPHQGRETSGAFAASMDSHLTTTWLVDSGASSHMTWDKRPLTNYQEFVTPEKVGLGDDKTVDALGVGNIQLRMEFKVSQPRKSVMHRVMYVPKLARNLFSVRAATTRGNMVKFGHSQCWIRDRFGKLEGMGRMVDKLYQLDCEALPSEMVTVASAQQDSRLDTWHY